MTQILQSPRFRGQRFGSNGAHSYTRSFLMRRVSSAASSNLYSSSVVRNISSSPPKSGSTYKQGTSSIVQSSSITSLRAQIAVLAKALHEDRRRQRYYQSLSYRPHHKNKFHNRYDNFWYPSTRVKQSSRSNYTNSYGWSYRFRFPKTSAYNGNGFLHGHPPAHASLAAANRRQHQVAQQQNRQQCQQQLGCAPNGALESNSRLSRSHIETSLSSADRPPVQKIRTEVTKTYEQTQLEQQQAQHSTSTLFQPVAVPIDSSNSVSVDFFLHTHSSSVDSCSQKYNNREGSSSHVNSTGSVAQNSSSSSFAVESDGRSSNIADCGNTSSNINTARSNLNSSNKSSRGIIVEGKSDNTTARATLAAARLRARMQRLRHLKITISKVQRIIAWKKEEEKAREVAQQELLQKKHAAKELRRQLRELRSVDPHWNRVYFNNSTHKSPGSSSLCSCDSRKNQISADAVAGSTLWPNSTAPLTSDTTVRDDDISALQHFFLAEFLKHQQHQKNVADSQQRRETDVAAETVSATVLQQQSHAEVLLTAALKQIYTEALVAVQKSVPSLPPRILSLFDATDEGAAAAEADARSDCAVAGAELDTLFATHPGNSKNGEASLLASVSASLLQKEVEALLSPFVSNSDRDTAVSVAAASKVLEGPAVEALEEAAVAATTANTTFTASSGDSMMEVAAATAHEADAAPALAATTAAAGIDGIRQKSQQLFRNKSLTFCRYYNTLGYCRNQDACPFYHARPGGRFDTPRICQQFLKGICRNAPNECPIGMSAQ